MKHRFFVSSKNITGDEIVLAGENAAHSAVLRLAPGEEIVICDGAAMDYRCIVACCNKSETRAKVVGTSVNTAESSIGITLYQALPKAGKMDEIIEKCTQLGILRIVPVIAARCVTKLSDRDAKKIERWQKIARAAAAQSQRGKIPRISDVMTLKAALQQAKTQGTAFVCYESENRLALKTFLQSLPKNLSSIAFFIGPEGGFDETEAAKFKESGIATVSLGSRILRTELAGAVVLANTLYELER
jgi:16S rRNA (uracil1498-N3)-methyltransferase